MMDPDVFTSFQVSFTRKIGQRRVDDLHPQPFEEPAVAAWRKAIEARRVYGGKEGNSGTPKRHGPRGCTAQG